MAYNNYCTDQKLQLFKLGLSPVPHRLVIPNHKGEEGSQYLLADHDLDCGLITAESGQDAYQGLLEFVVFILLGQFQLLQGVH